MTETSLLEKKDLREQLSGRVEVLDNVKKLFLIPELDMMTVLQIAEYYAVDFDAIKRCYQRNKDEIDNDGTRIGTPKELTEHFVPLVKTQGYQEFGIANGITLRVPNRGIRMFSKRAILRIGMLLRDSEVAKEVRTQLLNTFEHTTVGQKTVAIDDEQGLIFNIGKAVASGDAIEIAQAAASYIAFKDRHINQLQQDNKMLSAEILSWDDRSSINKAIRVIATKLHVPFGYPWKWLYDELRYKHNIGLTNRGKAPAIQWVREDEWPLVQQSLCAICEDKGLSPSKVMAAAKLLADEKS
ncbi:hypothetical protein SDC9_52624 [bioreactor metagenome]|uniref:Uncharacterized protein n=1 Tax=bioreactor metagenome TaxID=1076179 RepID=A0A644WR11_9ZZZZ